MNYKYIYGIVVSSLLLSSCIVREDINFAQDGGVTYSLTFDGSEALSQMYDMELSMYDKTPSDTLISLSQLVHDSLPHLPSSYDVDVKNISPFTLYIVDNIEQEKYYISIIGKFKSISHLQDALTSLYNINIYAQNTTNLVDELLLTKLPVETLYSWSNSVMKREIYADISVPDNQKNIPFYRYIKDGVFVLSYHFQKSIKGINIQNATISDDRKSVTIEYPGIYYLDQSKINDLLISLN